MTEQKKRGRPKNPDAVGKRAAFATRITVETREALEQEASRTGRTLSEVAELWLEQARTKKENLFADLGDFAPLMAVAVSAVRRLLLKYPQGPKQTLEAVTAAEYAFKRISENFTKALDPDYQSFADPSQDIYDSEILNEIRDKMDDLYEGLKFQDWVDETEAPGFIHQDELRENIRSIALKAGIDAWGHDIRYLSSNPRSIPVQVALDVSRRAGADLPIELDEYFELGIELQRKTLEGEFAVKEPPYLSRLRLREWAHQEMDAISNEEFSKMVGDVTQKKLFK